MWIPAAASGGRHGCCMLTGGAVARATPCSARTHACGDEHSDAHASTTPPAHRPAAAHAIRALPTRQRRARRCRRRTRSSTRLPRLPLLCRNSSMGDVSPLPAAAACAVAAGSGCLRNGASTACMRVGFAGAAAAAAASAATVAATQPPFGCFAKEEGHPGPPGTALAGVGGRLTGNRQLLPAGLNLPFADPACFVAL